MRSLIEQDFQLPPDERIIIKTMMIMIADRGNLLLHVGSEHCTDYVSLR
jgi:hypothetical protein